MIKDNNLLEKYNKIWDKFSKAIKKGFDSEPVYNKKYLKTEIKSYKGEVNTNVHNDKIPKESPDYICLSVVLIDTIFKTGKN